MQATDIISEAAVRASLRACAIHEAGHAVVAEALTAKAAQITISEHRRAGEVWHQGHCVHVQGASAHERRLIGLAGACAEVLDGPHRGSSGDALCNVLTRALSVTDAESAGPFSRADVDHALRVAHRLQASIEARAQREIAIFNDGQRRRGGSLSTP